MTDEVREEAAQILAICASIPQSDRSVLTYGEVCYSLRATDKAMFIAGQAWSNALRTLRERGSDPTYDVIYERHLVYAEAEALVRTGAL